jgi:deoxyribodipyrimidine photo-lyase
MKDLKKSQAYIDAVDGRTGIDCFDHWIKDLGRDGYLHNHTRMWFASIWIHTLRLPWQLGADIFLKYLVDGDPASNTLSWRWVAGLHTKGKSYLAYPENIKKFTNGKFYPSKQLATHVKSAIEEDKPLPKQLNLDSKLRSGKKGFLVHESDLSPNFLNEYDMILIQGSPLKSIKRSSLVQSFISDALKEYQKECTENQKCDVALINLEDTKMIKRLMNEKGLSYLSSNYPALGAVNDQIQKLRNESIIVDYQYQKWDRSFWPHSSKGFFKLKSKIPKILKQLNCM